MKIWVLVDDRIGSNNQSIAIAEKISKQYEIKNIVYNSFIKIPNFIRKSTLIGVDKKKSSEINKDFPDLLICAGRRLSSVALHIKKLSKGKTFVVNIMNPNLPYKNFDLLIFPAHDNTPKKYIEKGNIVEILGALSMLNQNKINEGIEKFTNFFGKYKKPYFSLFIGGDTKKYKYIPEKFGSMIADLSKVVNNSNGSLFLSSSRRTSNGCINEIEKNLNCEHYFYNWAWEINPENKNKNELGTPYFAMMGLSDFLITTGDSISIISEACSTGRPVYVYMPKEFLSKKHYNFCLGLLKNGYIKEFNEKTNILEKYSYEPLNELDRVVNIINKKIKEKNDI